MIFSRFLLATATFLSMCCTVSAQDYPSRQIRWVVPYPAGGGADILARIMSQNMQATLKQPIVVENKPGGNTRIATQFLAKSPADGYTVMNSTDQIAANSSLYKNVGVNATQEVDYVGAIVKTPLVLLARLDLPATSVKEVIEYIKNNDKKVNYGSWGLGSTNHLTMEALAGRIGTSPTHVPFQGAAPAATALLGGVIDLYFTDLGSALPYIKSGKLKAIAVTTKERIPMIQDIPTIAESGFPDFDVFTYQGLLVPKGTPSAVINTLNKAIRVALDNPEIKNELLTRGVIPDPGTPEQFKAQVMKSEKELGEIIRRLNIVIE